MATFGLGGQPWIRTRLRENQPYVCPFCGDRTLKLSVGDIPDDDLRVEAYCDNSDCAVRTMTILAMRIGEPPGRADIEALERIDADPERATRTSSSTLEEQRSGILARRRSPSRR